MKTNEAPDKIYMPNELLSEEWTRHIEGEDIEYTRTDAFIEKACGWLRENKNKYVYNWGERGGYFPTCSNLLIRDFKKYMKGE